MKKLDIITLIGLFLSIVSVVVFFSVTVIKFNSIPTNSGNNGVVSIAKTDSSESTDTYTITYSDGSSSKFTVTNDSEGIKGIQGEKGADGHTPVITIGENGNWFIDGVDTTQSAQGLKGDTGNGISNIEKTSIDGLIDTYTITFTNGETTTFTVTNGSNGIQGIQGNPGKDGEDGHTPIITIGENGNWFIDGEDSLKSANSVKGDTGNGISNIEKTSTNGLIDTYTITFTNGETTTFTVTNGSNGIQGIQGEPGNDGIDGHTPVITIGENGNWFIDGVDTTKTAQGIKGDTGNGISKIEKTSTEGLVDTYTITFTNGTTTTFTITNGGGESAYQLFLKYNPDYTGTEEEWVNEYFSNVTFVVTFDSDCTVQVASQTVRKGEKALKPTPPTKTGYTFDGWYYDDVKWEFIGYVVTEDMTLKAKWIINNYDLNVNKNIDKAGTISDSGSYHYNESVTLTAITNPGYTFDGWYDGDDLINDQETYTFNMPAENITYTAKWTVNTNTSYRVEHYLQNIDDDNYPELPEDTDNLSGTTDTDTNGSVNTYEGFTAPFITQININGDGSTILKLYYTRNSYNIILNKSVDSGGTLTGIGTYKYGKEITIFATTNEGFEFNGWYDGDNLVYEDESYEFTMPAEDIVYTAKWRALLTSITLNNAKTAFNTYDTFSFGGVVTANYGDGSSYNVTSNATYKGYTMSKTGTQTVTVSYTDSNNTTKTKTYSITVSKAWRKLFEGQTTIIKCLGSITTKYDLPSGTKINSYVEKIDVSLTYYGFNYLQVTWSKGGEHASTKEYTSQGTISNSFTYDQGHDIAFFKLSSTSNHSVATTFEASWYQNGIWYGTPGSEVNNSRYIELRSLSVYY